jgi:YD repeat-containing protein
MSRFVLLRPRPAKSLQLLALVVTLCASAVAQSGDVVISANTAWPANTYTLASLTVNSGATLTIGGGSTVNVTGGVLVTAASNIVLQGVNTSAQVNGAWLGAGSTITAGSIEVDAGSTINADQQGYTAQSGPGAGAGGTSLGGSYGGAGGGQTIATTYGSASNPTSLGSGGGSYQSTGGTGGGALQLNTSGTLTNNGIISANGGTFIVCQGSGACGGGAAGGGAGGSVNVTTATLTGNGTFEANGGGNASSRGNGGGGGRVAIYYNASQSSFSGFISSTSSGGGVPTNNGAIAGATGTVAFFDTSAPNDNVTIYQNYVLPAGSNVQYNTFTVTNGALLTVGGGSTISITGGFLVTQNSTVVLEGANTGGQLNGTWAGAGDTIQAGSLQVDAGSTLNADGQGYLPGNGPGAGAQGTTNGGSFGGAGGGQGGSTTYGAATGPSDLGSGGGQYQGAGLPGGGALRLNVSGTLTNYGVISANAAGVSGSVGGSAGGSVYVTTATLAGSGTFTANGAGNTSPYGNGGGGGRVAVYSSSSANFSGFVGSTATGGGVPANGGVAGANGTVGFFDTSVANNNLSVYQNFAVPASVTATYNSVSVAGGGTFTLGGGSQLIVAQTLDVAGTLTMQSTNNQGQINGSYQGRGGTIVAQTVTVESAGTITADLQGYAALQGPGAGGSGTGNGGSYGGLGGGAVGNTYGSQSQPIDLGSGGGIYQGASGPGGGAIELEVSGTLTQNGVITANGAAVGGFAGAGSGGSIYIAANTIAGTGSITANGGGNSTPYGDGGGGGRIALYYSQTATLPQANLSAAGGLTQGDPAGAAGTIVFANQTMSSFVAPTGSVVHGVTTLSWFSDAGGQTNVLLEGPQTQVIAQGSAAFNSQSFDTTQFPDGRYELRLQLISSSGAVTQEIAKNIVINNSVTWHSGILAASQEWSATTVHALDGNVTVPSGVTLTIDAGTIVKAANGGALIVASGGTLVALGGTSNPVTLTTFDDYSIGGNTDFNQGLSQPTPGEWGGVEVLAGGTFTENANTVIRYALGQLTGTLAQSTTLLSTMSYAVTGTLTVPNGITLTILPGAVVKMGGGAIIDAQPGSTVVANGTLAQPIYITSANDNSVGTQTSSGTSTSPAPGDWNSLIFDGATVTLNHVQVQYGGGPVTSQAQAGMIETTDNANVMITNSVLDNSFFVGLQTGYPNGGGDTTTVTNTVFYGIEDRAINAYSNSTVHVVNDTFDGNAAGAFNHGGTMDVSNSVISNSLSAQFGGIGLCCGGTFTNLAYNDVYSTNSAIPNYVSVGDPTGTNGNISANPIYMNGSQHDYRPTYGSPLIDAASAQSPAYPATDAFGLARYNDPLVTVKTGVPDANGNYPDIGAFEFVSTAPSNLDLTVSNVQGPSTAITGSTATLTWTVTNIGTGTVYGPWHDGVSIVSDPGANQQVAQAGDVLEGQGVTLGPGESYQATGTITVPGVTVGTHCWQIHTNDRGEIFEGANENNNIVTSVDTVTTDMQQLVPGSSAITGTFTATGQGNFVKVVTTGSTQAITVQLTLPAATQSSAQLFVGGGYIPTPQTFDVASLQFNSITPSVVIPAGPAQTYYVLLYGQQLQSVPATYTISAAYVPYSLTAVTPSTSANSGYATLQFTGGGFTSSSSFALLSSGGTTMSPTSVFIADADHADVTFNLTGAVAGTYSAQVSNGSSTVTLANAFAVTQFGLGYTIAPGSGQAFVSTSWETPEAFRAGFASIVTLHYQNTGSADIAAPLLYVTANNATLTEIAPLCSTCSVNQAQQVGATYTSGVVLGISNQGPSGVLPAGASGALQFLATPAGTGSATFYASTALSDIVKWLDEYTQPGCIGGTCPYGPVQVGSYPSGVQFCNSLMPPGSSGLGFSRACMLLLNRSGFSYGTIGGEPIQDRTFTPPMIGSLPASGFNQLLANDATELSSSGQYVSDGQRVLGYELAKDGLQEWNHRYHLGAFGFGPSHPFDITLNAFQTPEITYPDGTSRIFPTTSPNNVNLYLGTAGDYGTLLANSDGTYLLTESDGRRFHFTQGVLGVFDYFLDRAGNKTTFAYAAEGAASPSLVSVTDALGRTATYQYDGKGHITQYTDFVGRVTRYTYTYTPSSINGSPVVSYAFLTSITNALGTTSLQWNTGGPSGVGYIDDSCVVTYCEPAIGIASITYPDGTHTNYMYDSAGRVIQQAGDGGAGAVNYSYNGNGSVTMTDALGNAFVTQQDEAGNSLSTTDPVGATLQGRHDAEGKLTALVDPGGASTNFGYDSNGNLSSSQAPLGGIIGYTFGPTKALLSATDANGNTSTYTYDSNYNLTAVTAPNGKAVTRTFDSFGRPTSITNKRGHTTTLTYNSAGMLASKTYANGAVYTYGYDAHNNLTSSSTAAGTMTYAYDNADRLIQTNYPNGSYITYTYSSGGQHTATSDSTGHTANYAYDAAGRLSTVKDGSGNTLATYTYDLNNNVISKTLGNGATTAISYDGVNDISSVNNTIASAGGVGRQALARPADVNPQGPIAYLHNLWGAVAAVVTPSGQTQFSYNEDGRLTTVATPATTTTYTYDLNGNRTQTSTNGITTTVDTNNLDQTTNQGTRLSHQGSSFDADGNCTLCNGMQFTYDDDNRVTSVTDATGNITSYTYDAIGNALSTVNSLGITSILNDLSSGTPQPFSTTSPAETVANNFAAVSSLAASAGTDLVNTVQTGTPTNNNYYQFDGQGNTVQTTNASGSVTGTASYMPLGDQSLTATVLPVPFTYQGQSGASTIAPNTYNTPDGTVYSGQLGATQQQPDAVAPGTGNNYQLQSNGGLLNNQPLDSATFSFSAGAMIGVGINLHSGDIYLTGGVSTGVGPGITGSRVNETTTTGDARADMVDGEMTGLAVSGNAGPVGATVTNGQTSIDFTTGGSKLGVSAGYTINLSQKLRNKYTDGAAQLYWQGMNFLYGGLLFNDSVPNPFNPNRRQPPCGTCAPPPPGIPGNTLFRPGPGQKVPVKGGIDPNGKITSGYGDAGFIPPAAPITYTVYFENLPTATAPAQIVTVTDQLAPNLDWTTVQLQQVAFNNVTLSLPNNAQTYAAQATVSTDSNRVAVTAVLNPSTGLLTWKMQSVDPITGAAPTNPVAGFLPPNNSANQGVGSVTFSVMPKSSLANATAITNQASIVFDANAAIATNTVSNTLDATVPTSSVTALPAKTAANSINLSWSGTDVNGSGVAYFNIYVSSDGGTATLWQAETTATSALYGPAFPGHSYTFYSLAVNNVGTPQTAPISPQTVSVTTVSPPVTVSPGSSSILQSQQLSVPVTVGVVNGYPTPAGNVVLSGGGYTSVSVPLTGGAVMFVIPANSLAAGSDLLTATYTPDSNSSVYYNLATGSATVTASSPTVPTISLTPSSLTFTTASGTTSSAQSVTLTNTGSAALSITSITIVGSSAAAFAQMNTCGSSLGAGASCQISVTFAASSVAGFSASLSIADNAGSSPQTVSLIGTGTAPLAPAVSLTPGTLTFSAYAGTASAAQAVTLTNTGNAALSINTISISGSGASNFAETNTCGTSLAAGANCKISVTFISSIAASSTASLYLADNASGTPQSVMLSGTATAPPAPAVLLSPSALTFNSFVAGTSVAQTVTLTNTGNAALNFTSFALSGANSSVFAQTTTCGASLAINASCTFSVTFSPTAAGSFTAALTLADNAPNSPQSVALSGTAVNPPTFSVALNPTTQYVLPGGSASYTIVVTPMGGSFNNPISLSVSGLPASATSAFSPATLTPGANPASSTLTISTSSLQARAGRPFRRDLRSGSAAVSFVAVLGILVFPHRKRRTMLKGIFISLAILFVGSAVSGCAGHSNSYTFTVTVSSSASGGINAETATATGTLVVQ